MTDSISKTVASIEEKLAQLERAQKELENEIALKQAQIESLKAMIAGLERLQGKLS